MDQLTFSIVEKGDDKLLLEAQGVVNENTLSTLRNFATQAEDKIASMHEKTGKKVRCVFDLTKVQEIKDPGTVATLAEFQKNNKPHIERTALVVTDTSIKLIVNVAGAMAMRDNIQIFDDLAIGQQWAYGN